MDECTDDNGEPVEPHFACKHCEHTCAAVDCDVCGELVPVEITITVPKTVPKTGKTVCAFCF